MRYNRSALAFTSIGAVLVTACATAALPDAQDSSTLLGRVVQSTNESGYTPEGYSSQYAVWIAIAPSPSANAGVVVNASAAVYLSRGGIVVSTIAGSIRTGDSVQVWRDNTVAYGAVEAPPGAPCYSATKVVILR